MIEGFQTARLRAEPIGPEHRDGLIAMLGDERVGATLGGVADPAAVDAQIAEMRAHREEHGFGWYASLDRANGALLARGGPHRCHVAGKDEVEIGWTVVPARWNQGIASELGAASIEVAFGPLALPDVVSFTLPHNHASRRVMEKLGFAYERDTDYKGWPHVLYRLRASAQRERFGQAFEHRRDRRHAPGRHVDGEDVPRR
jgi:[ribosomal protein S5]-alanine N-acetyltransferase